MESYSVPPAYTDPQVQEPQASPQPPQPDQIITSAPPPKKPFFTKKLLLVIGLLVLLLVILGAVYAFKDKLFANTTNQPVTLTYWGLWETPQIMQPLIDEYQSKNPHVTIRYEQRPLANHYTTVKSRLSQSATGEIPDIVRLHSSWVPVLANNLSNLPSSAMTRTEYESNFYPATKDTLLINNNYYAIPLTIDGLALVYNQDLFNQAGIGSVPTTWDDVRQAASKITKYTDRNQISTAGIAMGSATNIDHFAEILGLLMSQNGVSITNSQGQVAFDKSVSADGGNLGAEALAFYTLFSTTERSWDDTMESSTLAFTKGKVGMILVPSWRVLSLVEQNPQLQIRVAPAPQLASDRTVSYASYWVESVPRASKNQAEAWKFLAWMSQSDQQVKLATAAQQARTLSQVPANVKAASIVANDLMLAPYADQAPGYKASIFGSSTGAVELNEAINQALAEAVNSTKSAATNRQQTAAEALTDAAVKVNEILADQR